MTKNIELGAALATAITVAASSGCANTPVEEKGDDENKITHVEAVMVNPIKNTYQIIPRQPVNGQEGCEKFSEAIVSNTPDLRVRAVCLNEQGEAISTHHKEYEP